MKNQSYTISYAWDDTIITTQLGHAIFHADHVLVHQLIENGINWSVEGVKPLHAALFGRQIDYITLILSLGSPVDDYALYLAMLTKVYRQFFLNQKYESLLDYSIKLNNMFLLACRDNDVELAKLFLKHGADIRGTSSEIPLHEVIIKFNREVTDFLLSVGVDINQLSANGVSALRMMAESTSKPLEYDTRKAFYHFLVKNGAIAVPQFSESELMQVIDGKYLTFK